MKTDKEKYGFKRIKLCLILIIFFLVTNTSAADVKRVALIPFKINAKEDLTYLRDGINDMLTTRLSQNESVTVIQRNQVEQAVGAAGLKGDITEAEARGIGSELGAAFVMIGSLTVLKENVSIDAKMIDIAGHRPTMAFFEQAGSLGEVISRINTMASQINSQLSGQTAVAAAPAAPAQQQVQPAQKQAPKQVDRHAHPEKMLKEGRGTSDAEGGSPFIMSNESQISGATYWKSPSFKKPIHGLAIGDVTGDGNIETVIISDHSVMVYSRLSGRFFKTAEIAEGDGHNLIGVDVADINDNGKAEIFVSSLTATRQGLNSYVLEYDGKKYVKLVDASRWYFRVVESPARGKILVGQHHRKTDVFSGGLQELTWQGGDYIAQDALEAPKAINAMGIAMGDVTQERQEYVVAFKSNDHIQISDGAGKIVWTGTDRLGGSNLYYLLPMQDRGDVGTRRYYPMRPHVRHLPGDEKPEVLVARNFEMAGMKLEQFRQFTGGQIEAFVWDGMGLANKWRTRKLTGFIRDFAVGDFDNDGGEELIIVLIQRTGDTILTTPKSNIVAYDMVLPTAEKTE